MKQSHGKIVPEVLSERPDDPDALMYLWDWYGDISRARQSDAMTGSPHALSYDLIYYWQKVTGYTLSEPEVNLMFRLDAEYRRFIKEAKDGRNTAVTRGGLGSGQTSNDRSRRP